MLNNATWISVHTHLIIALLTLQNCFSPMTCSTISGDKALVVVKSTLEVSETLSCLSVSLLLLSSWHSQPLPNPRLVALLFVSDVLEHDLVSIKIPWCGGAWMPCIPFEISTEVLLLLGFKDKFPLSNNSQFLRLLDNHLEDASAKFGSSLSKSVASFSKDIFCKWGKLLGLVVGDAAASDKLKHR